MELAFATRFISSKNNDAEQIMHSKSDNIEVATYHNANHLILITSF